MEDTQRSELGRALVRLRWQDPTPRERQCAVCGTTFTTVGRGVYCSRRCQVAAYRARRRARAGGDAGADQGGG